ncbi:hypothetical protein [Limosilactobacillus caecicola]|uniref:hypothetical protein n=1 Tax=Limosilactobacillus caecicola TaxID=2941332 RepID=UPI0020408AEA|nr:hypothetical protein [Limosilactobacillus caecicola]
MKKPFQDIQPTNLKDQYGAPTKAEIWFGNPYMPWRDPQVPGGKWGQLLTIRSSGKCEIAAQVFNDDIRQPIAGQDHEEIQVTPEQAQEMLDDTLKLLNYFGKVDTDHQQIRTQETTIWTDTGKVIAFYDYAGENRPVSQLAMAIRRTLGQADLMVFDGNSHDDFIDRFTINYAEKDDYHETLVLNRADNSITYDRKIKDGPTVTTVYRDLVDVTHILDNLNSVDFAETIPGIPEDVVPDQEDKFGHFDCVIQRRQLRPIHFSGDYEQYCLPKPWTTLMKVLGDLMDVPPMGELLNPDYYQRRRRTTDDVIYLTVTFNEFSNQYQYLTDDDSIEIGDQVVVPVGDDDHEQTVTVAGKHYYKRDEVPYPLDKVKEVIRKANVND